MNEIAFKALFFKYVVRGTLGLIAVYILGVMCTWWVNWEFPWAAFDITDRGLRGVLLSILGLNILFCAVAAFINKTNLEIEQRINSYTAEEKAEYIRLYNEMVAKQHIRAPKTRSKSPSILDIGLGVASGVVLGEIVNDLIDGE